MYGAIPQTFNPITADNPSLPLPAQAQALAARLSPQVNMARQGGQPGGISPGHAPAYPLIAKNPWGLGPLAGGVRSGDTSG